MCYTLQISIQALLINLISGIYLYYTADEIAARGGANANELRAIALFFLFVGGMQMWDTIFWLTQGAEKDQTVCSINRASTKAAMLWNHAEPLILMAVIIYVIGKKMPIESKTVVICYAVSVIAYTCHAWKEIDQTRQTPESGSSLDWQWNRSFGFRAVYTLFLICLFVLFYQNFTGWVKWLSILLTGISFGFSMYKYSIQMSTGRFWCYFAAFAPLFYLCGNYI
jgi:hypothetical protein